MGITDENYKDMGVIISKDEKKFKKFNVHCSIGLLSDEKLSNIKENQTFIGVLNPYNNKEKLENLVKKINLFSLRITSKNYKSSIYGYFIITSKFCWL